MRKFVVMTLIYGLSSVVFSLSFAESITLLEKEMNQLFEKVKPSVVSVKYSMKPNVVTTGILIDKQGHVVTTRDFSGKPRKIEVELSDGEKREAEWVGGDRESRVAVIKVEGTKLDPAAIGNSDNVMPASWAMIVGNSMGLSPSISIGHISGKRKDGFFQLSANISPGNSGAGVFNTKGELIGIVAARLSPLSSFRAPVEMEDEEVEIFRFEALRGEGFSQGGSGVAIPINRSMEIAQKILKKGGDLEPGWLGVYIQNLDEDLKESVDADHGVLVSKVVEDSPAEEAGIREGDVIVAFDKEKIEDTKDLQRAVRKTQPGAKAKITVLRKGKKKTFTADIKEREDGFSRVILRDFDLRAPDVRGLRRFSQKFKGDKGLEKEMREFKKEMKSFKKEMEELKKELKHLQKKKI